MARDDSRPVRIAAAIRRELGELIATEVKDPRVSLATVTDVELSDDLGHARVFISSLDVVSETDRVDEIVTGLQAATGFFKKRLNARLRLRVVPQLRFIADTTERNAQTLDRLIEGAVASDRASAAEGDDERSDSDDNA
ncbi:30S ribosome-binding factor RbfA [Salinisphaera sp. USBA-960]|uniref:30S ribosome-binding factor RbfA n=1 Tax=Salinisphaera orenii TaxID=856731 RepID=UPI0013A65141|nr:30S ribosome-binding factor RbfA [Salifodinibacter halophilus]NNC25540.1 30S ribosome-binding factor RbfA [Salifodinibacter halophilus]